MHPCGRLRRSGKPSEALCQSLSSPAVHRARPREGRQSGPTWDELKSRALKRMLLRAVLAIHPCLNAMAFTPQSALPVRRACRPPSCALPGPFVATSKAPCSHFGVFRTGGISFAGILRILFPEETGSSREGSRAGAMASLSLPGTPRRVSVPVPPATVPCHSPFPSRGDALHAAPQPIPLSPSQRYIL